MYIKKFKLFSPILLMSLVGYFSNILYAAEPNPSPDNAQINEKNTLLQKPNSSLENTTEENQYSWNFLQPYRATYEVSADGENLGNAVRAILFKKNSWTVKLSSKIKKWMLTMKSDEYSIFNIQDNQLLTQRFFTSSKVTFKKRRENSQNFNWKEKIEIGKKGNNEWNLPIDKLIYDRMSHLVELRKDVLNADASSHPGTFKYLVSYKGKREIYTYKKNQNETIITSMGELPAIRMDRVSGDDTRFSIWLCPELDYIPIKIAQFEQDKPDIVLKINQYDLLAKVNPIVHLVSAGEKKTPSK